MFFASKSQKYAPVSVDDTVDSADESDHLYKPEENAVETPSFLRRCLNFLCSGVIIVLILLLVIIWSLKYDNDDSDMIAQYEKLLKQKERLERLDDFADPVLKTQYDALLEDKRLLEEEIRLRNITTSQSPVLDPDIEGNINSDDITGKVKLVPEVRKDLDLNNAKCIFMTTYFINKANPLLYKKHFKFNAKMFRSFYHSISIFTNHTDVVIFIDFDAKEKFSTERPDIKFININFHGIRYTINDYRYFLYLNYLKENDNYDLVLMADISDVRYGRDPFEFFLQREERLFTNEENDWEVYVPWMRKKHYDCYGKDARWGPECIRTAMLGIGNGDYFLANAGIFGGYIEYIKLVLEEMVELLNELKEPKCNANMIVFGGVMHQYWKDDLVLTGPPLHAPFRSGLVPFHNTERVKPNPSFVMYHK